MPRVNWRLALVSFAIPPHDTLQTGPASSERLIDMPQEQAAVAPSRPHGRAEFRNVWFAYQKPEWAPKGVSFDIDTGTRVALIGHTRTNQSSQGRRCASTTSGEARYYSTA
jgi:ABC-type multidrug transport system fused ATPase/permease subunit